MIHESIIILTLGHYRCRIYTPAMQTTLGGNPRRNSQLLGGGGGHNRLQLAAGTWWIDSVILCARFQRCIATIRQKGICEHSWISRLKRGMCCITEGCISTYTVMSYSQATNNNCRNLTKGCISTYTSFVVFSTTAGRQLWYHRKVYLMISRSVVF